MKYVLYDVTISYPLNVVNTSPCIKPVSITTPWHWNQTVVATAAMWTNMMWFYVILGGVSCVWVIFLNVLVAQKHRFPWKRIRVTRVKETRRNRPSTSWSNPTSSFSIANGCINILFWNIHVLSQDKLSDSILGNVLKKYDIILLSETWASDQDDLR